MADRPRGREKHVTSGGAGVHRRGEGQGTGPVGAGRPGGSGGGKRSGGGQSPLMMIIVLIIVLLGGGGGLSSMLGGGGSTPTQTSQGTTPVPFPSAGGYQYSDPGTSSGWGSSGWGSLLGSSGSSAENTSYTIGNNTGKLDTTVASGSREKYTKIRGNGKDITTIMIYMCGTDLESRSGMATSDLQEMLKASFDDHINLIVYTGGCKSWRNNLVSSSTNQIYQIKGGKISCLEKNLGSAAMTKPDTLTGFIKYCAKNFPADRNDLILWDHGGGSVSGYGYDEKYANAGAMSLAGIKTALDGAKIKFDFIGFDACLMATLENANMLSSYADYLIASEETEPGVGWYYTNWLTKYGKNPSMSTLEVGQMIVDDFVNECARSCRGQDTTLSVIDLAELSNTVPKALNAFAEDATAMIKNKEYQKLANARGSVREFAKSTKIDQVDFVHLTQNIGTEKSVALAKALLGAVKYNRTSSGMTNAYGLSIYWPSKKMSSVDSAVRTYKAIGMDEEYTKCIQEYASLGVYGQAVANQNGHTGSPVETIFGSSGQQQAQTITIDEEVIAQLLGAFLSGGRSINGWDPSGASFLSGRSLTTEEAAAFIAENQFDGSQLVWSTNQKGQNVIRLSEDQWKMVTDLEMNMFYDDGEGLVDLGTDNVFSFDEEGNLVGETDKTWLSINGQPVAYYYLNTVEDGDDYTITGYVPAMLNGVRVNLMLVFDQDNPYGYVAGSTTDYIDGETDTVAKALGELEEGDKIDFLCDFYSYDGEYEDSYFLGEQLTVSGDLEISNTYVGDGDVEVTYRFTDMYGQNYWTAVMP